jgi:hypothetical protein
LQRERATERRLVVDMDGDGICDLRLLKLYSEKKMPYEHGMEHIAYIS